MANIYAIDGDIHVRPFSGLFLMRHEFFQAWQLFAGVYKLLILSRCQEFVFFL